MPPPRRMASQTWNDQGYDQGYNQDDYLDYYQNGGQGHNQSYGQPQSQSQNRNYGQAPNQNYNQGRNQSFTQSSGQGFGQAPSQNYSQGHAQSYSQGQNQNYGRRDDQNYGQGHNYNQSYDDGYNHGYGQPITQDQVPPRGPSAPPAPGRGPYPGGNRRPMPPMPPMPQRTSPDGRPSHPTPVRPGQMPNSLVNPNGKPPPMRNYGGVPPPQQQPMAQDLPPQRQFAPPQRQFTQEMPPQQERQYSLQQQPQYMQDAPPQQERQYAPPPVPTTASLDMAQEKGPDGPVTTQELEQLRMIIKANPADQRSALRLAKRLIEAADVLIPQLPDPRARSKARDRYLMDAHKILKKLASHQNIEAMFTLADGLGKSLFGPDPDTKEAFTLYQSAAKLGHAAAAYRTAVCCEIGHEEGGGTRRDPQKAIQWYRRAATLGDTPAMYKMGMVTLKGLLGQTKSPREAVGWLKRAAEQADADNPHALHELGMLYESAQPNDSLIRDDGYALSLFQQAAELGYKFSQFRLGCAYEYGQLGCPIDPRLSIVWYSKAAMQEEHQSELALSGWYLTGSEGVLNQSDTEAYLWARKAAVAGLAKAEFAMAYFTEVGIGIPPNIEDAKRWYWRAAGMNFLFLCTTKTVY